MSAEAAYDLNNFAAKTESEHDRELKTRSLRLIKNRRKAKTVAPVKLILGVLAVIGIVNDPTTDGLSDSERAMHYETPSKE